LPDGKSLKKKEQQPKHSWRDPEAPEPFFHMGVEKTVEEICDIRYYEIRMYGLQEQMLSVLSKTEPVIETPLAGHSVLPSPLNLLDGLLLCRILRLLKALPFEIYVFLFFSEGLAIETVDNCPVKDKIRNDRLSHGAAEAI
jgi:hypothetical protein